MRMRISFIMLNLSLSNSARWAFNVAAWQPTESQYLLASSCIQEEEKSRIGRFVFKKDAKASLTGRLLLRKYVCDTSGLPYSEINFDRDVNGRPRLVCDDSKRELASSLHFNVSHHGDYAVLAGEVGNVQLGIDVMKIEYTGGKPLSEFFRLMTRHFSMQEWNTIRGVHGTSESKQLAMFIRHWCLKESYVKALGVGITVDLRNISFKVKTPMLTCGAMTCDTQIYVNGKRLDGWLFEETLLDEDHCVTVALKQHNPSSQQIKSPVQSQIYHFIQFDELMAGCKTLSTPDELYCKNFFLKDEKHF